MEGFRDLVRHGRREDEGSGKGTTRGATLGKGRSEVIGRKGELEEAIAHRHGDIVASAARRRLLEPCCRPLKGRRRSRRSSFVDVVEMLELKVERRFEQEWAKRAQLMIGNVLCKVSSRSTP